MTLVTILGQDWSDGLFKELDLFPGEFFRQKERGN